MHRYPAVDPEIHEDRTVEAIAARFVSRVEEECSMPRFHIECPRS